MSATVEHVRQSLSNGDEPAVRQRHHGAEHEERVRIVAVGAAAGAEELNGRKGPCDLSGDALVGHWSSPTKGSGSPSKPRAIERWAGRW
jgi:hypothetical protein